MATLLRRRDEHGQLNNVSADVEANVNDAKQQPVISPDSTFEEPGSKIWGPYLELADKYDKDLVHNWRDDMDSLLIFAALFSASVTAFVIESYKTLVQDSEDVTVDILLQISRQLANVTQAPITMRPPFQPDSTDIAINVFWFLSLAFSLACALAAVLVRQWARQYLRFPRSFSSTTEQARARQFLFENVQWWKMELVVEMIPALLHISLILFFIGLLLFAHSISVTLAIYLLCFSMISGTAYAFITATPLIFPGCPYKTPFSSSCGISVRYTAGFFATIWKGITMILACFLVSMLSGLSFFIKIWSPSYTIPEWKWAVELSEPIRSPLIRYLTRILSLYLPSGGNIHQVAPRFIQFLSKDRMSCKRFWTSTISSPISVARSISKSIANRRQFFQNEISMRDAHALHWAMEFTKKDVDLFTIIKSVPEYVQIHDLNTDIHLILWMSGVRSQTHRLLRSSVIRSSGINNQSILLPCLESIIWSTECSTQILEGEIAWFDVGTHATDGLLHDVGQIKWQVAQTNEKDKQTLECAYSNLLLRWVFLLEKWVLALDDKGFQEISEIQSKVRFIYGMSRRRNLPSHTCHDLSKLANRFSQIISSREDFREALREFRAAWATQFLNISFSNMQSSLSFDAMIWNSLCGSATHLPPFPLSTRDNQEAIFVLVNGLCRALQTGKPVEKLIHPKRAELLLTTFSQVLFGEAHDPNVGLLNSPTLHQNFIRRVHVYHKEGSPFQSSGRTVEISFDTYRAILDDLMSSIQMSQAEYQPRGRRSATYRDIISGAIRKIIRGRLRHAHECADGPIIVDARHLTVARFFERRPIDGFAIIVLLRWTAAEFGYASQLKPNYNIEMHAELQYYAPGIYGRDTDL